MANVYSDHLSPCPADRSIFPTCVAAVWPLERKRIFSISVDIKKCASSTPPTLQLANGIDPIILGYAKAAAAVLILRIILILIDMLHTTEIRSGGAIE